MIPDHLIDKGIDALINPARTTDMVPDWRLGVYRDTVQRIIEAVAADIWDHGYVDGVESAHDYFNGETKADTPNPYRESETA